MKKVAVVIPCYNEAAGIAQVIAKFPYDKLARQLIELTVYVVDNNSSDDTAAIAQKAGAIVICEHQKGKGNALRTGFKHLPQDIDYVVMLDGDDTYAPEEIIRLIEPLESDFCDVVVGSRLDGRIQKAAMSRFNLMGNRFFTRAVRVLYHAHVTDVLTGYFAWKKSALDDLEPHITSSGFAIEMEMITKMARLGLRLMPVPISYHPRSGDSNLRPLADGSRILGMLLKNLTWRPPVQAAKPGVPAVSRVITEEFAVSKIVFVSDTVYPYTRGSKEKRLYEITTRLAAMGHDVHIYTMHWWSDPQKVRFEHGVQMHALCGYHEMYHGDRRTIKESVIFALACLKLFRVRFDVIDVDHMPFLPILSIWVVCTLRGRKLHATWHEALLRQAWISYMGPRGMIADLVERLSIQLPHRIIAASPHTKELLAFHYGRVNGVELVAPGVDVSTTGTPLPLENQLDVLYMGPLVRGKNLDKLLVAMSLIVSAHPNVQCAIVGQGADKQRLQDLVFQLNLEHNITFEEPFSDAAEVYAYMQAAKVFCSPSVHDGFGIAALEALGYGTPVITIDSPHNAARHLIQNGRNGSVVPLEPASLAQAILYWISQPKKILAPEQVAQSDWQYLAQQQVRAYML